MSKLPTVTALADIINGIIKREAGYVNNPKDSGGETNWGVTVAVARAFGYQGSMMTMPRSVAYNIYVERYWSAPKFNSIQAYHNDLALFMCEIGVMSGQARAARLLQRLLNVFNRNGKTYADIETDGQLGKLTFAALDAFLRHRGEKGKEILYAAYVMCAGHYFVDLAERRSKDEEFVYGWISRTLEMANIKIGG